MSLHVGPHSNRRCREAQGFKSNFYCLRKPIPLSHVLCILGFLEVRSQSSLFRLEIRVRLLLSGFTKLRGGISNELVPMSIPEFIAVRFIFSATVISIVSRSDERSSKLELTTRLPNELENISFHIEPLSVGEDFPWWLILAGRKNQ